MADFTLATICSPHNRIVVSSSPAAVEIVCVLNVEKIVQITFLKWLDDIVKRLRESFTNLLKVLGSRKIQEIYNQFALGMLQ